MNVLFVHSEEDNYSAEKPLDGFERMQFGISYISSFLKSRGHQTRLVVPARLSDGAVERHIEEFEPGLICFTSVFTEFEFLSSIAERIKNRYPDVFLLVGGPHASLKPEECLVRSFDAVCVGEGEYPTLELVEQLEAGQAPAGIPNLYIKRGAEVERNAPRPFNEDIDSLPFPDRDMWMPWLANPLSRPSVLASRGCPFQCTYCCNHALSGLAGGRYVRMRSPDNVYREIRDIKTRFPLLEEVYLEAETLGVNQEWAIELCSLLEGLNDDFEVPISYGSNLRVTPRTDYDELFAAFRRSNFRFINIGLESGSERVRRDVLKRNYSNDDILRAVRQARKHGLEVGIYNLIGLPGETRRDFRDTVRVNRACRPDWYLLSVFFPYPGTRLYDVCVEQGLLDMPPDSKLERRRPVLDLPGFGKRAVGRRHIWSALLIYGGYRPIREVLWLVTMAKVYSRPRLLRLWRAYNSRFKPYQF